METEPEIIVLVCCYNNDINKISNCTYHSRFWNFIENNIL